MLSNHLMAAAAAFILVSESFAGVVSYARNKNLFTLKLSDGAAEIEWISPSAFRFCRMWKGASAKAKPIGRDPVEVTVTDAEACLRLATKWLRVEIDKAGVLVRVSTERGSPLTADAAEIRRERGRIIFERQVDAAERFRGLGPRTDTGGAGVRGTKIQTTTPFLTSTLGYAEHYSGARQYLFDLAASRPDRRQVELYGAERAEYFFYYGPKPLEILEEHVAVSSGLGEIDPTDYGLLDRRLLPPDATLLPLSQTSWEGLKEAVARVFAASYSAILLPAFDLSPYLAQEGELARRAAQLAAFMPLVCESGVRAGGAAREWLARRRARLTPYLVAYAFDADDRGFPLIRPLSMQFPTDPEAAKRDDQFMLGDDLLVAPVLALGITKRPVYLPMGVWTDLRTNKAYKGRQTIEAPADLDDPPVFGKNGSIVPEAGLSNGEPMVLHYFPRLGAELFLYENQEGDFSQFHAAPALDFMRLESEPVRERTYEWVVHHSERCKRVVAGEVELREVRDRADLRPGTWFYDARLKNLHVQARVPAGADHIINISF